MLINRIVNYIFGVEWEDPERAVLTEIHTKKDAGVSQTKSAMVYKIGKHDKLSPQIR